MVTRQGRTRHENYLEQADAQDGASFCYAEAKSYAVNFHVK